MLQTAVDKGFYESSVYKTKYNICQKGTNLPEQETE